MANVLKISVTGVRGIVGQALTPELLIQFARAFATYMDGGRLMIGRDTRPSGEMVRSAVLSGLLSCGCEVVDLGICPAPTLQFYIKAQNAQGGIAMTGGHNPEEWNALKFIRNDGIYLSAPQGEELLDVYHQGEFRKASWTQIRPLERRPEAIPYHLDHLVAAVDAEAIRARQFVVALDCCNGACSRVTPLLLDRLGCRVLAMNDDPNGHFPHHPDPIPSHMSGLSALVKASGAHVGFAHDASGERLGIVDEQSRALPEEWSLALLTDIELRRKPGLVVTNLSTTSLIDHLAKQHGGTVLRTPVGQAYVAEAVQEHGAVIGGEGSGGIIWPRLHSNHDSLAAIVALLDHMARTGESVGSICERFPRLHMIKRNIHFSPREVFSALEKFRDVLAEDPTIVKVDLSDGVRLQWPDGWLHVRASNTESMIRIISEAAEEGRARQLADWAQARLS